MGSYNVIWPHVTSDQFVSRYDIYRLATNVGKLEVPCRIKLLAIELWPLIIISQTVTVLYVWNVAPVRPQVARLKTPSFGTWQAELFDFAQIWPEANRPEKKSHVRGQDSNNLNLTSRDLGFIKNKSMFPFLGLIAAVLWFLSLLVICDFNLFHFVIWHQKWWNKWPKMTLKHFKRQSSHGLPVDKRASHVTFRRGHVTRAIFDRKRRYKSRCTFHRASKQIS